MNGAHQASKLGVLEVGAERRLGDIAEARGREQLGQVTLARAGESNSSVTVGSRRPRHIPEEPERAEAARVVPDARRNDAARSRDAAHLGEAGDRVGHEVDHQLGERGVERAVVEGQRLGDAWRTSTPGWRSRAASTNGADGSTAAR